MSCYRAVVTSTVAITLPLCSYNIRTKCWYPEQAWNMKSPPSTQLPVQNAAGTPSLHWQTEALLTQVQIEMTGHETRSRKMQKDVVWNLALFSW